MSPSGSALGADLDPLARVDERIEHLLHVHGEGLGSRLRAAGITRLVPRTVGYATAVALGRADWLRPSAQAEALARAGTVLPGAPAAEQERFARAHLIEMHAQHELFWRPPAPGELVPDGIEHLDAAVAAGRGAIVATTHFGPMTHLATALGLRYGRAYLSRRSTLHAAAVRGSEGRWIKTQRRFMEDGGARLISRGGTVPTFHALLARGAVVILAWDVPGRGEVEFLGAPRAVSRGIDHLAAATGAAVLPSLVWRDRTRLRGWVGAPVAPDADGRFLPGVAARTEPVMARRLGQVQAYHAKWLSRPPGR